MKVHWTQRVEASLYPEQAPEFEPPSDVVIELECGAEIDCLFSDDFTAKYEVPNLAA